ncbi:hypothetical protein COBT_000777 [Conglomerata obtusa]
MVNINKENDPDATVPYEDNFLDLGRFMFEMIRMKETEKFINFIQNSPDPDIDITVGNYVNKKGLDMINYAVKYGCDEIVCCLLSDLYVLSDIKYKPYIEYYKMHEDEIEKKYDRILSRIECEKNQPPKFNRKDFEI